MTPPPPPGPRSSPRVRARGLPQSLGAGLARMALILTLSLIPAAAWAETRALTDTAACDARVEGLGAPRAPGSGPDTVRICRAGYDLGFDPEALVPVWVVEVLTPESFGAETRGDRRFRPDPDLARACLPFARDQDYVRARLRDLALDRGHLAPAADQSANAARMDQSFLLSNVAPQVGPGFNRAIWKDLETRIRTWAQAHHPLVVISGVVTRGSTLRIGARHTAKGCPAPADAALGVLVPTAFYKVILSGGPKDPRAIAYLMPNEDLSGQTIDAFAVPVEAIARATGLEFFPDLAPGARARLMRDLTRPDGGLGAPATGG